MLIINEILTAEHIKLDTTIDHKEVYTITQKTLFVGQREQKLVTIKNFGLFGIQNFITT